MNIFSFTGLTIVLAIISVTIKKYAPEFFILFNIISSITLMIFLLPYIKKILNEVDLLFESAEFPVHVKSAIFKTLGICLLTKFATDICEDSDQRTLADKINIFGKISMLLTAMPIFKNVIEIATNIFNYNG
ncbi:MAG: stage III sporulation AC/AD family protein [Firmicutes bacterium]|nr:stage III sporulation AC/AD family protein [Bacillota bacterium]